MDATKLLFLLALHVCFIFAKDILDRKNLKLKKIFYLDESKSRMLEVIYLSREDNHKVVDCFNYGDKIVIKGVLGKVPKSSIYFMNSEELTGNMNECSEAKLNGKLPDATYLQNIRGMRFWNGLFIYPGTKWCGAGNISNGYDDLGHHAETDRCCREHDHCEDFIVAFGAKHGLKNFSPVTKSNCSCDDKFHRCLQTANSKISNRMGRIYFNLLQMQCFKMDHPILGCLEYKGLPAIYQSCQEYELNVEEDPIWQFFDARWYKKLKDDRDAPDNSSLKFVFQNEITSTCIQHFAEL